MKSRKMTAEQHATVMAHEVLLHRLAWKLYRRWPVITPDEVTSACFYGACVSVMQYKPHSKCPIKKAILIGARHAVYREWEKATLWSRRRKVRMAHMTLVDMASKVGRALANSFQCQYSAQAVQKIDHLDEAELCLEGLDEYHRELLEQKFILGLTYDELSQIHNRPWQTMARHCTRALNMAKAKASTMVAA